MIEHLHSVRKPNENIFIDKSVFGIWGPVCSGQQPDHKTNDFNFRLALARLLIISPWWEHTCYTYKLFLRSVKPSKTKFILQKLLIVFVKHFFWIPAWVFLGLLLVMKITLKLFSVQKFINQVVSSNGH